MLMHRRKRQKQESQHTHRWLVSYADYMTIMFAFFVVMYAIAINKKEDDFAVLTHAVEQLFTSGGDVKASDGKNSAADGLLEQVIPPTEQLLEGHNITEQKPKGPTILEANADVSLVQQRALGEPLDSALEQLTGALIDEIRSGRAELGLNEDWLTIELSSGMLFASGSATVLNEAKRVVSQVAQTIAPMRNYIRVRGYTDNEPINNELFRSNWHLSATRAVQMVQELQQLDINPARMAIEGYGQYSPFADNDTAEGRAQNRKVVIAISKYALPKEPEQAQEQQSSEPSVEPVQEIESDDNSIKIIQLPHGGIRITTRNEEQQ